MDLKEQRSNWDLFADQDPLFAVISWPEKKGRRWDEKEFFENGRREIRGVLRYVSGLPARPKRGRAMDFGCGVGRLTQALAASFERVTGVDVSPRMLDLARRFAGRRARCEFILNARPDLSLFGASTFDFVYSNITLQHMRRRLALAYVGEFIRVLKPGGIALFQVPSDHRPATPGSRIRWTLRRLLPGPFLASYRWFQRSIRGRPVVEMHTIPKGEVVQAVEAAGGRILDIVADPNAGPEWPGYRYAVLKPRLRDASS